MWDTWYGYYEIRHSAAYAVTHDTVAVQQLLDGRPELQNVGLISYESADCYPYMSLSLVHSSSGNYAIFDDTWNERFTIIPVVCSKSENGKVSSQQLDFLKQLAQLLQWELTEEENDEGEENVVLYQPA